MYSAHTGCAHPRLVVLFANPLVRALTRRTSDSKSVHTLKWVRIPWDALAFRPARVWMRCQPETLKGESGGGGVPFGRLDDDSDARRCAGHRPTEKTNSRCICRRLAKRRRGTCIEIAPLEANLLLCRWTMAGMLFSDRQSEPAPHVRAVFDREEASDTFVRNSRLTAARSLVIFSSHQRTGI